MIRFVTIQLLLLFYLNCFAQSTDPYAIFGHTSKVKYGARISELLYISNSDTSSNIKALAFDAENGYVVFIGVNDSVFKKVKIEGDQIIRFISPDPLDKKYPSLAPYAFVANTPLNAIDPDGQLIIFVNGFYHTGGRGDSPIPDKFVGTKGGSAYWGSKFINGAKGYFNDQRAAFIDGRASWTSSGKDRFSSGYAWAKANYSTLINGVLDANGIQQEAINVVSHSMGAAYSEGVIKYLEEQGLKVTTAVHLSAADPSTFEVSKQHRTVQLNYENDIVLGYKNYGENNIIKGVNLFGEVATPEGLMQDLANNHARTKFDPDTFKALSDLENLKFNFLGNTSQEIIGDGPSINFTWGNYSATGNTNGTLFNMVKQNDKLFKGGNFDKPTTYTGPAK